MKKYLKLFPFIFIFSSCGDYLDVRPESQIEKEVLFSTEYGFFEALNGVYVRCTEGDIYGNELTFGSLDVLAQNYSFTTGTNTLAESYAETAEFKYQNNAFVDRKNRIWNGLYNAIGNCNLILQNIDEKEGVFTSGLYAPMIKGEAKALRAYIHFDLLRLFAPSFVNGPAATAIPYVTKYSTEVTPQSTVSEVLDLIIADLLEARSLLESDPILAENYVVGYTYNGDFDGLPDDGSNEEQGNNLFLQNRRHRMNYYAVCAELARVYLYKNDKVNALKYALEVIDSGKFPWTDKNDFTADDDRLKDRVLYKELIFGWYIPAMEVNLRSRFENIASSTAIVTAEGNILYETGGVGADDFRYKEWMKQESDGITRKLLFIKYKRDANANLHSLMAPALRLSEMYYIAAECSFDTNPEMAWGYFNTVRFHRGIGTEIRNSNDYEFFIAELIKEARKEFYGEGQIFYMYKRLNRDILAQSGGSIAARDQVFVWPMPDDEIVFGNRN
ncbi:RagB/SusD family nutrient uptake outer membrane protein [Belliella sp. DSM 111904]|uniref:RagB/SusD family nutrient uptake outer membrane protein n=1 Tax=Belliella filtrata TaxID=2923435 RepID=A0ABS9V4T9_9BACT|nr:RagB/SusD family nutrient uptake outer membrane protein [Belliella filtrata]MCH7411394.1 RagB/SusD family nutrient uptake outer membrane protein [Belliella filtrata]